MPKLIVLRLEGPMQSWGLHSQWQNRQTEFLPTKSGVVGLLASALGLRRYDTEIEILHRLSRFGVGVLRSGPIVEDYHTMSGKFLSAEEDPALRDPMRNIIEETISVEHYPRKAKTFLTKAPFTRTQIKSYLQDSSFVAVLEFPNEVDIVPYVEALQHPRFTPYLGRRACVPTRPIFEAAIDGTVEEFFSNEQTLAYRMEVSGGSPVPEGAAARYRHCFGSVLMSPILPGKQPTPATCREK